jgi:hypothetical protein
LRYDYFNNERKAMTTTITTDRERFADFIPGGNFIAYGMVHNRLAQDAMRGLEAAAGLFFGEYEDEDTLPHSLIAAYSFLSDLTGETSELYESAIWA